jgi:hypothetical protein
MPHVCFHCKQTIPDGVEHDCWTTTEQALTKELSEDLRDAWERIRETAVELGEQRIYASHHSIMFSRKACYFFVRPQRRRLEVVIFLARPIKSPLVQKIVKSSKTKHAHLLHIVHRDQVEAPITEWLAEAYRFEDEARLHLRREGGPRRAAARPSPRRSATAKTGRARKKSRPQRRRRRS